MAIITLDWGGVSRLCGKPPPTNWPPPTGSNAASLAAGEAHGHPLEPPSKHSPGIPSRGLRSRPARRLNAKALSRRARCGANTRPSTHRVLGPKPRCSRKLIDRAPIAPHAAALRRPVPEQRRSALPQTLARTDIPLGIAITTILLRDAASRRSQAASTHHHRSGR